MRVGILGGGQLGWMTILEGRKLGFEFFVLEEDPNAPACRVSDRCFLPGQVEEFSKLCDVVTYEFEHIPNEVLERVGYRLTPALDVLHIKKSRIREKSFYAKGGYPTPRFTYAKGKELLQACQSFGFPLVLKRDRLGYDGKGQYLVRSVDDLREPMEEYPEDLFLLEEYVEFDFEYSVVGVRDKRGRVRTYTPTVNHHQGGILLYNYTTQEELKEGKEITVSLMEDLKIVGLLAVEFFYAKGKSLINEMAPRPHNTGHYTLDGSFTSQFENLLRAISDLPLGSTDLKAPSGMVNLLGLSLEDLDLQELLSVEGSKLYWYGKEKRPRRKVGHVNVCAQTHEQVREKTLHILRLVYHKAQV